MQSRLTFLVVFTLIAAIGNTFSQEIGTAIAEASTDHPRLFITPSTVGELEQKLSDDPLLERGKMRAIGIADDILPKEPVERTLKGKRLLRVSRTCLERVSHLTLAALLSGRQEYADRAKQEMLAVAQFKDWNPKHFLDVAEMTAALAIGYDWLHSRLDSASRATIRTAIIELGLRESLSGGWWVGTTNNWNQVCHGGLCMGALAIMEYEPDLAENIISRALTNVPKAMDEYKPDGAYPEGPGYWDYGTSFNVMLISAFQTALGTDFGLSAREGFMESAVYSQHATGPSGLHFNYSDCRPPSDLSPAMFWFAAKLGTAGLLWYQRIALEAAINSTGDIDRLYPFLLVWSPPLEQAVPPSTYHYIGTGKTPVGMHRSSWESTALYTGIKAGSPGTNHGHMDIGSFVLDWEGERWVDDLGKESYNKLESAGVDLWNMKQGSERWTVFRLNNFSHNTLVVDEKLQRVSGKASIIFSDTAGNEGLTIIDMSDVYDGLLADARRGIGLLQEQMVVIQDSVTAPDNERIVRWGAVSGADITLQNDTVAHLRIGSKSMAAWLASPAGARFELFDITNPPRNYDEPNPGKTMLCFYDTLSAGACNEYMVVFFADGMPEELPNRAEIDLFASRLSVGATKQPTPQAPVDAPGVSEAGVAVECYTLSGRRIGSIATSTSRPDVAALLRHAEGQSLSKGAYLVRFRTKQGTTLRSFVIAGD